MECVIAIAEIFDNIINKINRNNFYRVSLTFRQEAESDESQFDVRVILVRAYHTFYNHTK